MLQLILAVQANEYPNARRLAELCAVSRRTIYRDLETLEAAGIPVRYQPERHGYGLASGFEFHPPQLEEKEAQSLLVLAHLGGGDDGIGLRRNARSAAWKMIQGLSEAARTRVRGMAEMIRNRDIELVLTPDRWAVYTAVLDAITNRRQIRLWVLEADSSTLNTTNVSPYRLLLDGSTWCLIGPSSYHRDLQVFRLPRIRHVELTEESYVIPPRFSLERLLGDAWRVERGPEPVEVVLRFSSRWAPEIQEQTWHPSQRISALGNGGVELYLRIDGIQEVLGWILSFGDQVEVISPPELRALVREQAQRMLQQHAESTPAPDGSQPPSSSEEGQSISRPNWHLDRHE